MNNTEPSLTGSSNSAGNYVAVELVFDEEKKVLNAVLVPCSEDPHISLQSILQMINDAGYGNVDVPVTRLDTLIAKVAEGNPGEFELGRESEYTKVELYLDEDGKRLMATLSPSEQEFFVSLSSLKSLITESGFEASTYTESALENLLVQIAKKERGTFSLANKFAFPEVILEYDEGSRELNAIISLSDIEREYSLASLKMLVEESGYGSFDISERDITTLLTYIGKKAKGSYKIGEKPSFVLIELRYDSETRNLEAVLSPCDENQNYSFASFQALIKSAGYQDCDVKTAMISQIIDCVQKKQFGNYIIGKKPEYTSVQLNFNDETGILSAELSSSDVNCNITPDFLNNLIKEEGFEQLYFESSMLSKLFGLVSKNERGLFEIGQRKDAEFKIEFDEAEMQAFITTTPPYGGRNLDQQLLITALKEAQIDDRCCDKKVLDKVVEEKVVEKLCFARGKEPVNGKDAEFVALVEEAIHREQKEDKTGKIDVKEIMDFTLVDPQTPLMRRVPAKPGVNGYTVTGKVIPAEDGDDSGFCEDLDGAIVSPKDENLLLAEKKGHPVILRDGVRVDKTLVVKNVGLSTGNIKFDGSLLVRGEVMAGMKIAVTGDIIVKDVVTNASLYAKNNITISCGVIGSDTAEDGESFLASLKAGGDITAQYINQAKICAGNNVIVKEYISHCETEAKNRVIAGQSGGKGRIFGGECYAQNGITANTIGADGGVKTFVIVGPSKTMQLNYDKLRESHNNRSVQLKQMKGVMLKYMEQVKANPTDLEKINKAKSVKGIIKDIEQEIKKMEVIIAKVEKQFKATRKADVSIIKTTMPNVELNINGAYFKIRQESKGGKFLRVGNDIHWQN